MNSLIEGRIVHYVLPDGKNAGSHRPAIVVRVWRGFDGQPQENGLCQLSVFTDYEGDYDAGTEGARGTLHRTSVTYAEDSAAGTWHWPADHAHDR